MRNRRTLIFGILVAMICLALVPAASAYTATLVTPASESTNLQSGSSILINLNDLADGDHVTYKITSTDLNVPGNTITLPSTNMPFDFKNGLAQSTLTTTGVDGITFTVTKDGGAAMSKTGTNTVQSAYNIKKGNYVITIDGTKTSNTLGVDYNVTGTVDTGTGIPNPAALSFTITGVDYGHLTIQVLDGTTSKLSKTFTIAPVPTPVPTYSSGDTGGGRTGPAAAPAAAPAQLAPAQQAITGIITELVSANAVTTITLAEGKTTASTTVDVGSNAGIGGTPGGSLSFSPGTVVTTGLGTPAGTIGAASLNLYSPTTVIDQGSVLESLSISQAGVTTLDFSSLFGSGGTTFNFFS
nr:hypothetical protein [uncultured Methanoregula sp.]